jgi:hypothetical protein
MAIMLADDRVETRQISGDQKSWGIERFESIGFDNELPYSTLD